MLISSVNIYIYMQCNVLLQAGEARFTKVQLIAVQQVLFNIAAAPETREKHRSQLYALLKR
jgi:hypothetical protein